MARRRGQLVCQHLENVSRELLAKYPDVVRGLAKGSHGIYALYRRDRLYYIGLATNLRQRLKQHLRNQHAQTWDRFSLYLTIGDDHLHEIESLFLRISKPRGNTVTPGLVRSENLLPSLRLQIKGRQRAELEDIAPRPQRKAAKKKAKVQTTRRKAKQKGRWPVLSDYVKQRFQMRFRYKGKFHRATVRRDGTIYCAGKVYNSPSLAAKAVTGRPANGWRTWYYERSPGEWVLLDELRKR